MRSKIHFWAVIKGIGLIALGLPLLFIFYKELILWLTEGANIFFVLMGFFGLFGVTFLIEGFLNFKQLSYEDEILEERFFFFLNKKTLHVNEKTTASFLSKKYFGIVIKWLAIEDENGKQIRFHNFQYKNFNALATTFQQKPKPKHIQIKLSYVNRVIILAFSALTIWMIISAYGNIIF
ncbi:MAG: hypothetical protein ACPG19_10325 [Saprospiraceae bacterium]